MSPVATVTDGGDTTTESTACATVTVAVPEAEPAVAVTVAVPFAAAVTRPEAFTVATAASALAHETAAPGIARPAWSRTSADS